MSGRFAPRLIEGMVRLGTWMPFGQVPELLAFVTGVCVDGETVRRLTEHAGAALVAVEDAAVARLEREVPPPPAGPPVQQLSADGAMAPLVGGVWAEVKTLAIGTVEREACGMVDTSALSYCSRLGDAREFARGSTKSDAVGEIVWEVSVDSTVTRAHQHVAGARRKPSRADEKRGCGTRRTRRSGGAEAG